MSVSKPKSKLVNNVDDVKDENGNWIRSYSPIKYEKHTTRAGALWLSILSRSKENGRYHKINPSYVGVTNNFSSFQEFAEWCQTQYGYDKKEKNGICWSLDKDLLVLGNKKYSHDTCLFVPQRVNKLLTLRESQRGNEPLGVCLHKVNGTYTSHCNDGTGKNIYLGSFKNKYDAHEKWQIFKVDLIRKMCQNDKEIKEHVILVDSLINLSNIIENDVLNKRETQCLMK